MQVQYCATSPGASQGPVSCEVSEYGYCGHGHNNLRNAPKVVNYVREKEANCRTVTLSKTEPGVREAAGEGGELSDGDFVQDGG